jgi:peptidoglycan/LPS O-acetylase OafA/YrhL
MDAPFSSTNSATLDRPRIRLAYLDGLRGLAALYVVLFHIYQECITRGEISPLLMSAMKFFGEGEIAVSIFIVLSGYCLMLPIAHSGGSRIPGGVLNYLKRRSWRILPPYYAALFLSLLLLALTLSWQFFMGFHWDTLSINFHPGIIPNLGAIVSHSLVVHNLHQDWAFAINGPMWSVATEWQIYFLFPALLLPLYRYCGMMWVVAIAFIISFGPSYFWSKWPDYTACPWFLGLFALGMAGALINFSKHSSAIRWQQRIPWGAVTATLWLVTIAKIVFLPGPAPLGISKLLSCLAGAATAALLIYCTRYITDENATRCPTVLQLFEARYAVGLGVFSYSLYLVHAPVLVLVHQYLLRLHLSATATFLTLLIVAVPLSLLISYIFYLKFEKPLMSNRRKQREATGS